MQKLTSKQVRQMWLDFFESKRHLVVPSKSLIPVNDPTLLWINSGVATLKDYFSGKKTPPAPRLTNSQKSIRTNDIENVGVTARHHTLFEMLGNFSIGDYFKQEVLAFATELLFDVYKLDKEKVYITYFEEDTDTLKRWVELGIDPSHMIKGDREMNFWDVGQGPCGPDTEIFYDRGEKYDPEGVGLKLLQEDLENDRYVEIWNIVFSQFNNDGAGNYTELAQKNIDTGAGLERLLSIFQDAPTNFDTDLFLPIIAEIEAMTGSKYITENYFIGDAKQTMINKHFKVMADHVRAVSLAIEDGAKPSNNQRGYIIRRLIRRAYRSGLQLGMKDEAFLYKLVPVVAQVLDVYPIDVKAVQAIIKKEELAFAKTINNGQELLSKELKNTKGEFDFAVAFRLFETFGFPIELTQEILDEQGIKLDISKFDEFKAKHADASRGDKAKKGMESQIQVIQEVTSKVSSFTGYDSLEETTEVVFQGEENGKHYVLLKATPFYATSGGQLCDLGQIEGKDVLSVFKDKHGNNWHILGQALEGKSVEAKVNKGIRAAKAANHSGTHLLAHALTEEFGDSVVQLGSENDEHRLRYDFPLSKRPSEEAISRVEERVNELINAGYERTYTETTFDGGKEMGATYLEGEDYGTNVRVVSMGPVVDFCGGTHVDNTKDIEALKITKLESKGSGIFRIEAVTSNAKVQQVVEAEIASLTELLNNAINKNKKLDAKYDIKASANTVIAIKEAITKAKADGKALNKKSKNKEVDVTAFTPSIVDGISTIEANVSPAEIKPLAIKLRETFPESLIVLEAPGANLVAVASNKFNAKEECITRFPNLKGGGNERFIMGKKA